MIKIKNLQHRFVKIMPDEIPPGVLYISMEYASAVHRCCCGCGEEVVTPLSTAQWRMTFDGVGVSLNPSVGNWNLRCRSHYIVRDGRVIDARTWTDEEIDAGRRRDKEARTKYIAGQLAPVATSKPAPVQARGSGMRRLIDRFKSAFS